MTLVLDLPVEVETELREAAAVRGVAVEDYAVERLSGKVPNAAANREPARRQLDALDELLSLGARLTAGTLPLADDAVARSYADYHDEREAA